MCCNAMQTDAVSRHFCGMREHDAFLAMNVTPQYLPVMNDRCASRSAAEQTRAVKKRCDRLED